MSPILISLMLQATAPSAAIDEFRAICLDTGVDAASVRDVLAERGGWGAPARAGDVLVWSRADNPAVTLTAGAVQDGQVRRLACMLSTPSAGDVRPALPQGLGPYSAAVDAEGGMYISAPTQDALDRRDFTFVQVSTTAGKTTLTAIRPQN